MRKRLMFTTALASAALLAAPALAGGAGYDADRAAGADPARDAPHAAASAPDTAMLDTERFRQDFEGLGFTEIESFQGELMRGTTADGHTFFVLLAPEGELSDWMAALPDMPEPADPDVAEAPDLDEPDVAEAPDLDEPDIAEAPEPTPPDIAVAPDPEVHAAEIQRERLDELRTGMEGIGFTQIQEFEEVEILRARTAEGELAFIIVGDFGTPDFAPEPGVAPDPGVTPEPGITPEADQEPDLPQ